MEFLGILMFPILIALFVLLVLAFLMPYFIYKIAKEVASVNEEAKKLNALTRQLLRAYGHDPEV
jgi:hypothetical protein